MYLAEKDHPLKITTLHSPPFVPDGAFVQRLVNYCNNRKVFTWSKDYSSTHGIVYWLLMAGF